MVVLDESRNGHSFHWDEKEDSSEARTGLDDETFADADIRCEIFEGPGNRKDAEETDLVIEENKPPDGGWGWFIILGCLVIRMICGGMGRSHGLFYKRFMERFHQSATATAWVTSLTNTIRLGTGPVVSILCNRFTGRSLVLVGACILSAALMITAFAPNQPFLYFSYGVLGGLGRSFALTPCPLLLGYYFEKRRSLAFGLAAAGFSLGGFVITPLVELMFQNYGFTGTFIVLSGLATNAFVCACLFRPVEFQRRLLRKRRKQECEIPLNPEATEKSPKLLNKPDSETSYKQLNKLVSATDKSGFHKEVVLKTCSSDNHQWQNNNTVDFPTAANTVGKDSETTETQNVRLETKSSEDINPKDRNKKKKKLISLSILKDIRFLTFLLALFCNSLPSSNLFLPSLAVSRGLTTFEAAYLLSINAGTDTVFRIIAGLVLDMKVFKNKRPIIYNAMTFIQAVTVFLIPSMWSFVSLAVLVSVEGVAQGTKNAQRSVVMVDLLGIDKLASSMALSMAVQAAGILLGPTISGLLKDIYDSYDGAFYFGGSAILAGAFIMAGGNIRKIYVDRQEDIKKKNSAEGSVEC